MQEDFIRELAFKGFTARIKRLSDQLLYDARKLYEEIDIGIEPNWHLVFLLLKKEKELTVTEIAQLLGFSHPAIIKIIKNMKERGFVQSTSDKSDSRRQLIQLTNKAKRELPELEEKWNLIQEAVMEFIGEEFLAAFNNVEKKLQEKNLYQRCSEKFKTHE